MLDDGSIDKDRIKEMIIDFQEFSANRIEEIKALRNDTITFLIKYTGGNRLQPYNADCSEE